jgi:hypothetical protein
VLENLKSLDSVEEDLIGFNELHEEDQERVKTALEEGHVSESEEPEGYSMVYYFFIRSKRIYRVTLFLKRQ